MKMPYAALLFSLLAGALPVVRAQQTAVADPVARAHQDIASLIPADTVAVARLVSVELVLQYANELSKAAGKENTLTADRLLGRFSPIPGKRELIDLRLPIVVAVSLPRATPPAPVLLLPVTDTAAYTASLNGTGIEPAVAGGYVAVPLAGKYTKPAAPSNLLASLPDGALAVYAEADKLTAAFGKMIGAALSAARPSFAEQLKRSSPGVDGEALADLYFDGIRTVLSCAKTLRFGVGYRDGKLDVFGRLQVKEGSDMDGWSAAPLNPAASGVVPSGSSSIELLMGADWQKLWPHFEVLVDRLADVYPKATADTLRKMSGDWLPVYTALGPFLAVDGDLFAAGGAGATLCASPTDVAALRSAVDAFCSKESLSAIGVKVGAPRTTEASGATISDRDVELDPTKLAGAIDMKLTGMGNITSEQVLQAVLGGSQLLLRVASKNGRTVVAAGKRSDAAALAALDGAGRTMSKPMQEALARVADCNPFFVQRIDFGALFVGYAQMLRRLDETLPIPEPPADATAPFVFVGGVRGDEWRAGVSIDVAGAARLFSSVQPR